MIDMEFALLEALYSLGGEADVKTTLQYLRAREPFPEAPSGLSWDRRIRRALTNLHLAGYLTRQAPGRYSLTHQGWQRFVNELAVYDPGSPVIERERKRKNLVIDVEVEPLEEGGFLASCPSIKGCHAEGNTVGESLENLEDVARTLLRLMHEQDRDIPAGLQEYRLGKRLGAQIVIPMPE